MSHFFFLDLAMEEKDPIFLKMEALSKEISYHADLYFNKNTSEIADYKYDLMVEEYNALAEEYPAFAECFSITGKSVPLLTVSNEGLGVIEFAAPMLSLKKAITTTVYEMFRKSFKDEDLYYEYKGDGLALEIRYKDWVLDYISTRSNDINGEDVTHNYPVLSNVPKEISRDLPKDLVVRGEALISLENFKKFNKTAVKPLQTPRNGVSGWLRRLEANQDPTTFGLADFYVYYASDTLGCKTYSSLVEKLEGFGFKTLPACNEEAILTNIIPTDIPTDGIVVKVDSLKRQKEIGMTSQFPKWAIAYKFPFVEEQSVLERVYWNTGKTGRVVPTVHYTPVIIGGVVCRKASLDNHYQFLSLGLRNGTVLGITRNGDVIPRINRVIAPGRGRYLKVPTNCPSCGSLLEIQSGKQSTELVCNNVASCDAQLHKRCVHFVSKKAIDIDGLGPVKLLELVESGRVKETSDILYRLDKHVLNERMYYNILKSKEQPLWRVINALGLPNVGETLAKKLAQYKLQGMDLLVFLKDTELLMKVPGINAGTALPIAVYLRDPNVHSNATKLLQWFVVSNEDSPDLKLKGCITGVFSGSREEVINLFDKYGIELSTKLTGDCQFLVVGDKPGQSKLLKATQKNIPVFKQDKIKSIEELAKLIERSLSA